MAALRASSAGPRAPAPAALHARGGSAGLGRRLRAGRRASRRVAEEWGAEEPQATQEWCGQAVRRAQELGDWAARAAAARGLLQREEARLGASAREAAWLRGALQASRAGLVSLHADPERLEEERARWEADADAARARTRRLEQRLLALHRPRRQPAPARPSAEEQRRQRQLEDLGRRRIALQGQRDAMSLRREEREGEARVLERALGVQPSAEAVGESAAQVLVGDYEAAEAEAEVLRLQLQSASLDAAALRDGHAALAARLATERSSEAAASSRLRRLEDEEQAERDRRTRAASELQEAHGQRAALASETAELRASCEAAAERLRGREARLEAARRTACALEAGLAAAAGRAASAEAEAQQSTAEMEDRCTALHGELESQGIARQELDARRAANRKRHSEQDAVECRLREELRATAAAGAHLEAGLAALWPRLEMSGDELRAEEGQAERISTEAAARAAQERRLATELASAAERAQEARCEVEALRGDRARARAEAEEALGWCGRAMAASEASALTVRRREAQLARSGRSCELMRATLGQRLAALAAQVAEARSAVVGAEEELARERAEHHALLTRLQADSDRRCARRRAAET